MEINQSQLSSELMRLIMEKWISKPIYIVSRLCIADILSEGPKTIEEIAEAANSNCNFLYRIMRILASIGIFSEIEYKKFCLTPMAELLRKGKTGSIYSLTFHSDWNDKAWSYLFESVKTGKTAFELAYGTPLFNWLEKNKEAAKLLNEANAIRARGIHAAIFDTYDFSKFTEIIDVGGGKGSLLMEILKQNLDAKGMIAELSFILPDVNAEIKDMGMQDRCRAMECNFFKKVPSGADLYILSNILHDWPEEQCKIILKNCYNAMTLKSKLLVIEMIIPSGNKFSISKLLDMEMLVITGGAERTEKEFVKLFNLSGFKISQIIPTQEDIFIIEVIKA